MPTPHWNVLMHPGEPQASQSAAAASSTDERLQFIDASATPPASDFFGGMYPKLNCRTRSIFERACRHEGLEIRGCGDSEGRKKNCVFFSFLTVGGLTQAYHIYGWSAV